MKLSDLLDTNVIITNLRARDKKAAIEEMIQILYKAGKISNPDTVIKALMDREAVDTTALGQGLAFPHARLEGLKEPVAVLAISGQGIDFKAKDGNPTYLFFLFLTPAEETELHLQILSESAAIFADKTLYNSIRKARNAAAALSLILHHEKGGKEAFFPLPIEEIYKELGTDPKGLSEDEAKKRLERYGPNVLREVKGRPLFLRFAQNLYNLLAVLLWIGGILSFAGGMPELGWAIFSVIIINAVFSFWQEYRAERALEALKKLLPRKARALRNGAEKEVPADELVPGDIILLEEGDSISADARLIEASDMRVDTSALTGESKPIYKMAEAIADGKEFLWTELPNLVFAGTTVSSGTGKAAVIATGMHTEIGRIASLTQELKEEKSPLQRELAKVTKVIAALAVGMGLVFFLLGTYFTSLGPAAAFIFAIGMIIGNVPEGLLPTVSLSLAMAVQRMAKRNALIKRLSSVETLGSTSVICTDKTGTLTTSEFSVTKVWVNGKLIDVSGTKYEPIGDFYQKGVSLSRAEMRENGLYAMFDACVLCNNAGLLPPGRHGEIWRIIGDPTEAAMLVMAAKGGVDIDARKKALPRIGQLPFEAVRKRMTTINLYEGQLSSSSFPPDSENRPPHLTPLPGREREISEGSGKPLAYVKGAPKETLDLCTHILINGREEPLTESLRDDVLSENDAMANEGLRVLGIAYRTMGFTEGFTIENTERDLVFIGLVGMSDPPRPEVPKAIGLCHRAGIRVIMVTGDYGLTALSIAKKIGLTKSEKPRVVSGAELSEMSDEALKKMLREEEVIFARVSPEHKMRVVAAFKEMDEVVAVTGDGVNDAPALKKADIGIAMGIRGSDVAKEAASMILLDDNFASIVAAIEEGRAVYANIKKFITYILTHNYAELVPFIGFILFNIPLPITVMQILAIDLGSDIVPALALGAEPPEPGTMDRPPRPKRERLLDLPLLLRAYGFLGPIEATAAMSGYFFIYFHYGWAPGMKMADSGIVYLTASTMCFAGIVITQIGNVFACRTERGSVFKVGFFSNRLVLWGIATELTIISLLIYTPFLQRIFGLAPIGLTDWAFLFAFAPILLVMEEIRKLFVRKMPKYALSR